MDLNPVRQFTSLPLQPAKIAPEDTPGTAGPQESFTHAAEQSGGLIDPKKMANLSAASLLTLTESAPGAKMVWETDLEVRRLMEGGPIKPVVREDGIYVNVDGKTHKFDFNGKEVWAKATGGQNHKEPVFDAEGNLYILGDGFQGTEAMLNSYDKDGNMRWIEAPGDLGTLRKPVMRDGKLYTACSDGRVKCYDLNGKEEWAVHAGSISVESFHMDDAGRIHLDCYADFDNQKPHIVVDPSRRDSGNRPEVREVGKWTFGESPVIDEKGNLYGFSNDKFRGHDCTGREKWAIDIPGGGEHINEVLGPDGNIYLFAMKPDTVACITPDGDVKWKFQGDGTQENLNNVYAWGDDGTTYISGGSDNPRLFALNPDGSVKWAGLKSKSELGNIGFGPGGILLTGNKDSTVRGFSMSDGKKLFDYKEKGTAFTSPFLGADNFLVITEKGKMQLVHRVSDEEFAKTVAAVEKEPETKPEIKDTEQSVSIDGAVLKKRKKSI